MEAVDNLRNKLSVSRISKITGIQRSYIYYNRKSTVKHRKSRIPENTINRVLEISGKKGFYESGRPGDNEYQKENEKLKKLIGDQALVIDELKKITEGRDNGSSK